jgi:hypothetical protein
MDRTTEFRRIASCLVLALLPMGCATDQKTGSSLDTRTTLVVIDISKSSKVADCAITVAVENRTGTAWDGMSYNLALHDKRGVNAGRVMGAPRSKVKPGDTIKDRSIVPGTRCEDISGAAPVYFGYYPAGKKQVTVHNSNVRIRFD